MRKFKIIFTICLMSVLLMSCGSTKEDFKENKDTIEKNISDKKDMSFKCFEDSIPGASYEITMNKSNNECVIVEILFSSATDVKNESSTAKVILTDEEYLRIQFLVEEYMNKNVEDMIYNTTSNCLSYAFSDFMKNDKSGADKWLNEYCEKMLKDTKEYIEEKNKKEQVLTNEKNKFSRNLIEDENNIIATTIIDYEDLCDQYETSNNGYKIILNIKNNEISITKKHFDYDNYIIEDEIFLTITSNEKELIKYVLNKTYDNSEYFDGSIQMIYLMYNKNNEDIYYTSEDENWKSFLHYYDLNNDEKVTQYEYSYYTLKAF